MTPKRAAQALALVVIVLVSTVAWPGLGDAFTTFRVIALAAGTAVIALLLVTGRVAAPSGGPRLVAVGAWLAVLGVSGAFAPIVSGIKLLHELMVVAWAVSLAWAGLDDDRVLAALRLSAAVVAGWAVLQWIGIDPWRAVGWTMPPGLAPRMRVFSTLGNPNHVGAFLAAVLPVTLLPALGPGRRWHDVALAAVVCGAIVATGSRGALVGATAGVLYLLRQGLASRGAALLLAFTVAAIATGILLGPARALGETWRGRVYIWRVAAPHLLDHPVTGWGPGSFSAVYPAWESERIERGVDADVRKYAAAQEHAHNDYVERLAELGVPGLVVWCAMVLWVLAGTPGRPPRAGAAAAAAAGVAALAAVSLVDFPMQRLVQRFAWWTLAVVATTPDAGRDHSEGTRA